MIPNNDAGTLGQQESVTCRLPYQQHQYQGCNQGVQGSVPCHVALLLSAAAKSRPQQARRHVPSVHTPPSTTCAGVQTSRGATPQSDPHAKRPTPCLAAMLLLFVKTHGNSRCE